MNQLQTFTYNTAPVRTISRTVKVTGKGQNYFINLFLA